MPGKLLSLFLFSTALACAQQPSPPSEIPLNTSNPAVPSPQPDTSPANQAVEPAQQPFHLEPAERRQLIDAVADRLNSSYVLPEMAPQLVASLKAHQQQGDYDSVTDGTVLAERLTEDLRAVSHDRHLRIEYSATTLPPEEGGPGAEEAEQYRSELNRTNCGFERVDILPGNVGLIKFNYFGAPDRCAETAAAAFKLISHADSVIFDIRQNHGGDPAMVALLASYLFDHDTHLDDLYNRPENKTTEYWARPEKVNDRLPKVPVYILTSRMSFSGAEQFCYDLHNLHRAVLIGEKTGGAAHPTRNHRLNDHFFIAMPEYRYINAVTHTDWEGEGIEPDVSATAWQALSAAEQIALSRLRCNAPQNFRATKTNPREQRWAARCEAAPTGTEGSSF